MKTLIHILALLILASPSVSGQGNSKENDDIYFNRKDRVYEQNSNSSQDVPFEDYSGNQDDYYRTDTQVSSDGTTIINNNYYGNDYSFNNDDYYDYAYASRIRRFHNYAPGFGYYDPFYTNMYWYNYDPFFYGTSIYMTYSWWNPRPWWGVGFGWGWGSCGFGTFYNPWAWNSWGWGGGWNSWGYPGFGYYGMAYMNPWNNPWNAYNQGYYHGFYNGYNQGVFASNNYFNSYDANSYYYGPRNSSTGASSSGLPSRNNPRPLSEKYQLAYGKQAVNSKFVNQNAVPDVRSANSKPVHNLSAVKPTKDIPKNISSGNLDSRNVSGVKQPASNTNSTGVKDIRNIHTPKPVDKVQSSRGLNNPSTYSSPSVKPQKQTMPKSESVNTGTRVNTPKNVVSPRDYSAPQPNRNQNMPSKEYTSPRPSQGNPTPSRNPQVTPRNENVKPSNTNPREMKSTPTPKQTAPSSNPRMEKQPAPNQRQSSPSPKMERQSSPSPAPSNRGGSVSPSPRMNSSPSPGGGRSGGSIGGGRR